MLQEDEKWSGIPYDMDQNSTPAVCLEGETHFNPSLGITDKKLSTITFIWQLFYLYTPKTLDVDQDPTAGAAVHQNQKYTDIPLNQLTM